MNKLKLLKSKIFWLSVFLIGSLIFFINYGSPWSLYKYNKAFENYLEDTHQQDFEIDSMSYDLMHGTYSAEAFEVNHPAMLFYHGANRP
ncbi:hypothetical protein [Gracilibacillus salinarum]|uniref:Alpha/beta hydrolase n=1 Tax=Gracilibacillus salinarum TaxID=2932255 RepID=A0ABY4GUN5_9BACI|nr:hypothetical protein [Gracilibacillus salinarum]UOQ86902.1 hypothetical protein MUN87_08470 [Gracilibacillus salinarum]